MNNIDILKDVFSFLTSTLGLSIAGMIGSIWAALKFLHRKAQYQPKSPIVESIRVVDAFEFSRLGWSFSSMMKSLHSIDMNTFTHEINISGRDVKEHEEGSSRQWIKIYKAHPECWSLLVKGKSEIIGWLLFLPLTPAAMNQIKAGTLKDADIRPAHIVPIDNSKPASYSIYFCGIAVEPEIYRTKGGALLLSNFYKKMHEFSNYGITIKEFAALAWTGQGVRLCQKLNLTKYSTFEEGILYWTEGDDLVSRFKINLKT
jgi:hypothetical protein